MPRAATRWSRSASWAPRTTTPSGRSLATPTFFYFYGGAGNDNLNFTYVGTSYSQDAASVNVTGQTGRVFYNPGGDAVENVTIYGDADNETVTITA